uniref:non-specific serine/threonine protein kinase n=1 Tax=Esox lucius TaxID=8010 RepID=A0A6Q2Z6W5_ESOLU
MKRKSQFNSESDEGPSRKHSKKRKQATAKNLFSLLAICFNDQTPHSVAFLGLLRYLGIWASQKQFVNALCPFAASFSSLYDVGKMLGQGGFGSVYEGTRKQDGKQEAGSRNVTQTAPGDGPAFGHVPAPGIALVMEHPTPEDTARGIIKQAVLACRDRGYLHRDVKGENLLLQTDTLQVKLIDFGCCNLLKEDPYLEYSGTVEYCQPECFTKGMYNGHKATVWSLGVTLFTLVNGKLPYKDEYSIRRGHRLCFKAGVSKGMHTGREWYGFSPCMGFEPTTSRLLVQHS